jgi:signal transduction histidine kinase
MTGTGKITWVNAAYVDAIGGSTSTSVIEQQIHLDNRVIDQGKKVLEINESFTSVRNIILHGNNKPTSITIYPVSGGVAGIALDATEVEILRRNISNYKTAHQEVLDKMDEAIVIFGSDQKVSFYNSSFSSLCSLDTEWLKSSPTHGSWLDHMNEKNLIPAQSDYVSWKNSELALYNVWPEEMPDEIWSLPDGKTLRLVRMRDLHGGVSLLFSDMTDSIKLKTELGKLINVQKATLDKLSEGIAVFGTDGRLRIHNASFSTIWNFSEDDLENTPRFSDLIKLCLPLYNNPDFWSSLRARATNPNPQIRHHDSGEIIRSDNRIFTWLSRPLPDGATLLAWEDVTSARKAQAALIERAEALEEADRMKSEFVGHVSYQLRTPLTTISGYSEFLQNSGAGEITDKQSEYIFAIQSASEDLAKTINDILDIAAIEANVLDLELNDIEIHQILEHSLDYVATKAEDTKISLSLKSHPKLGKIRGDEVKLKQVVYNLLTNALRFTKPGGVIELGGKKADGGGVVIWVKDNGVGIPTDLQPQVFSSFKSSRGGSGLGLALVQRFVERHGGWVELESEEDVGTCVSIYLPREAPEDQSHVELFNKTA